MDYSELLDAVVEVVYNIDAAVGCHRDAMRLVNLVDLCGTSAPVTNEHAYRLLLYIPIGFLRQRSSYYQPRKP